LIRSIRSRQVFLRNRVASKVRPANGRSSGALSGPRGSLWRSYSPDPLQDIMKRDIMKMERGADAARVANAVRNTLGISSRYSKGPSMNQRPAVSEADSAVSLEPREGWHCSHLYYAFDRRELRDMDEHLIL